MSIEQNKTIVRRVFEELINLGNKAVIDELFDSYVTIHDPFVGTNQGADAFRQLLGMFDSAFPGHRVTIDGMVAEGDQVSVLHTHTATHTGPFMGLPGTGKTIVVNGIELFRLRDGRIVEFWRKDDDVRLLMQLGILPMPSAT
jgi:steroid delta-isomerase-like uncharacterized protein